MNGNYLFGETVREIVFHKKDMIVFVLVSRIPFWKIRNSLICDTITHI